jgi:hypothetical protein
LHGNGAWEVVPGSPVVFVPLHAIIKYLSSFLARSVGEALMLSHFFMTSQSKLDVEHG